MATGTDDIYRQRILNTLVYIQHHLNEPLSIEQLAGEAHFSPYHFHHIFKAMVGESVMQHIRRLRLEWAVQRLVLTNQPVTSIALETGYETHEGFTRAFKAMFGQSPSSLRSEARKVIHADAPSSVHYRPDGELDDFEPMRSSERIAAVRIETVEPMTLAFVRHVGPYDRCGAAWERLGAWAGPRGLLGPQTTCVGLAYDDPDITPTERIRYDACISLDSETAGEGEVGIQRLRGGAYAMLTHRGPYDSLGEAIEKLYYWLLTSGRELRGEPLLMLYRNIMASPAPQDIVIDVCLPLKPAGRAGG